MAGSQVAAPAHALSSRTCPCHPGKLSPQWAVHAWLPVISGREPLRAVRGWPVHLAPCTWTVWMEGAAGDRTSGQKHHGATPTSFRVGSPPPSLSFLSPGRGPQRAPTAPRPWGTSLGGSPLTPTPWHLERPSPEVRDLSQSSTGKCWQHPTQRQGTMRPRGRSTEPL